MKKLMSLVMAFMMSICLVLVSPFKADATDIKGEDGYSYKVFDFSQMSFASTVGAEYNISGTKLNATFLGQWNEIQFTLPETLDMSKCPSVTFSGDCSNGQTCFKLYNTDGKELAVQYDFKSNGECTFSTDSQLENKMVNRIGIMTKEYNRNTVTIDNVKFKYDGRDPYLDNTISTTDNLLTNYGQAFEHVGAAVSAAKFANPSIVKYLKIEHNSVTPGNEMKPDAIMYEDATIPVSEAKKLGYYIPEGYTESVVPKLNFYTVDSMLKTASENGFSFRAHTLVWHEQTPDRFFRTGYSSNGAYVSKSVMNKRLEFYIRSVMDHVYNGEYSDAVYAWDVVNEYLHANNSGWLNIYGAVNTNPDYVKLAFQIAYDELEKYGVQDKVKLFYNDFNTYDEINEIKTLINNINADKKVCAGVGMQSHIGLYPGVPSYLNALQKFLEAGFEVQITELDATCNDLNSQAKYYYDLMTGVMKLKKMSDADDSLGKITALIFWGITDEDSWRSAQRPLLYSDYFTAKPAYAKVLQAYKESGYVPVKVDVLPGDVDGNKVVDLSDYTLLRRYLNNGGKDSNVLINEKNADVNKDGVVNFFDLVALKAIL